MGSNTASLKSLELLEEIMVLDLRYQQLVNVELQKADSAYKRKTDEIKPVKNE